RGQCPGDLRGIQSLGRQNSVRQRVLQRTPDFHRPFLAKLGSRTEVATSKGLLSEDVAKVSLRGLLHAFLVVFRKVMFLVSRRTSAGDSQLPEVFLFFWGARE